MQHKTIEQLARVADVSVTEERKPLSYNERLQRWADVLESEKGRWLNTLRQTEYRKREERDAMRIDDSPISLAFADPVLRREGLRDDSYGEAKRFFGLSDQAVHYVVCYCHYGEQISAATAARAVRSMVKRPGILNAMLGTIRRLVAT